MADLEEGLKWWLRYIIVPLIGSGGVIAIVIAIISIPRPPQNVVTSVAQINQVPTRIVRTPGEKTTEIRALLKVSRADQPLAIDGKMDEVAWSRTESLTYAVHPIVNDSTTAMVKLLWDDQYLYAAFDVNDTQVEGSTATPWDGDSVSVIIVNDGQIREYRHSLLNDRAGNVQSEYQRKGKTTFNNSNDRDKGFIIEMRIPWATRPAAGNIILANFLSVDHDQNPGGLFDDPKTVFSKISWDGDADVRTVNRKIQLLAK